MSFPALRIPGNKSRAYALVRTSTTETPKGTLGF